MPEGANATIPLELADAIHDVKREAVELLASHLVCLDSVQHSLALAIASAGQGGAGKPAEAWVSLTKSVIAAWQGDHDLRELSHGFARCTRMLVRSAEQLDANADHAATANGVFLLGTSAMHMAAVQLATNRMIDRARGDQVEIDKSGASSGAEGAGQ